MNYKISTIPYFDKQLKRLARKFPSLKNEYSDLLKKLSGNPESGTAIGNNCYKIRLSISSKNKGKSGGARVITYLRIDETTIFLLSIYDKSEQIDISDKELAALIKNII